MTRASTPDLESPSTTIAGCLEACMRCESLLDSIVAEGATVTGASINNSMVGVRARVDKGAHLKDVILMGSDFYEGEQKVEDRSPHSGKAPLIGVGKNCRIERCIIDKNVRIGDNVTIKAHPEVEEYTGERRWIRDGITILPKGTVIEPGTTL